MSGTMDVFVFKEHRCYRCKYYERRWKCGCKDSLYYAHECDSTSGATTMNARMKLN